VKKSIQYTFLFVLGMALFYAAFYQINFAELEAILVNGNYIVALPVFIISVSGYFFRISRWQQMLSATGCFTKKSTLFASLCVGYGVNFAVPRLGELTRCYIIKKHHQIPFEKSILSVLAERLFDTICLFFLLLILLVGYAENISNYLSENILEPFFSVLSLPIAVILLLLVLAGSTYLVYMFNKASSSIIKRYLLILTDISSLINLKSFWIYTLLIWLCYYLMTYLWFFTFHETSILTPSDAFVLMVVGSFGRSIPVQGGGMGAYHFLVANAAVMLGVTLVQGNALAVVIHGIQSIFTITLGLLAYFWLLFKPNDKTQTSAD